MLLINNLNSFNMLKSCLYICCLANFLWAYPHELRGTISDETGAPLEGVGVHNKTTGSYTFSNISGYFELDDVSLGDSIFFYSLGYASEQLVVEEKLINGDVSIILKEAAVSLDQIILVSKVNALSNIIDVDVKTIPVKSSQEILRKIPGLIIGQHAGGGKAEQIFLRGFDIDHGTDIAISVDGMPVNMVSHAHGQGYADMHFIIPETIENIDFGKGPYYSDKGNFNTAGYVELRTRKTIENNLLSIEAGQFNTLRSLSMLKLMDDQMNTAYMASEFITSEGYFDAPQNFNRFNLMGRFNYNNRENQELDISVSHFQSKWDASGQIPERAVEQGLIGRFGAIDATEGGNTSRTNLWVNHMNQLDEHRKIRSSAYVTAYDFELFSNFTFFLEDPENGDQIQQKEGRLMVGGQTTFDQSVHLENHKKQLRFEAGMGFRYDDVNDVQLSHTLNRKVILNRLAYGNVDELNAFGFINATYKTGKLSFNPGLRMDYLNFDYEDKLADAYTSQSEDQVIFAPHFNVLYAASAGMQFYAKSGIGFHSNDTRVVLQNKSREILPRAFGLDVGLIVKPADRMVVNAALWSLFLEQEFVYVGDAGIVEPSGETIRRGIDLGIRYQLADWLYVNGDLNYTYARSSEEPEGEDYIPLAPDLTSSGGLTFNDLGAFSGGWQFRFIGDRPAIEDNSIVAEGYFVSDFNLNYQYMAWNFGIIAENIFNTEWKETQFATESRLRDEPFPVEEIHFTPGSPFFLRGKISVRF